MCASDAAKYDIENGDLVRVDGQNETAILRALISDKVQPGQPFAPLHWTRQRSSAGTINTVMASRIDPVSGQPALKSAPVALQKYEADWFAFAASVSDLTTDAPYAAVARSLTGWQGEYAGMTTSDDWEKIARDLLETTDDAAIMHDVQTGQTRLAFRDGTRLTGVFFTSPTPVALSRNHAISLIGTQIAPIDALAGRARLDQPDPGQTICACMNVGVNTIRAAIADGAVTVDALGDKTYAGTSCGSCKPELTALIAQFQIPMAAE
jgi:assimilatory nitrate reductase catalytic subunit